MSLPNFSIRSYKNADTKSWLTKPNRKVIKVKKIDPLIKQLDHFIKVIKGLENPKVTLYDGLQNIKVIEAIFKSTKTGKLTRVN